ncbi:hypothetical protein [Mesorhizobium sp. M0118]|uniref:hypothetical protein n=1 Tax=Mesorhizobium sp. M0118 TaxID=2956884 RepID=UPI00333B7AD9
MIAAIKRAVPAVLQVAGEDPDRRRVIKRLMSADPSRFTKKRTVQLAVEAWRVETAERIILDGDWMNRAGHVGATTLGNIFGEAI